MCETIGWVLQLSKALGQELRLYQNDVYQTNSLIALSTFFEIGSGLVCSPISMAGASTIHQIVVCGKQGH